LTHATRTFAVFLLALFALLLANTPARAHKPSDSYLTLRVSESRIEGRWDIALRDLDYAIGLDSDADGDLTWGEVRARNDDIVTYALNHLRVSQGGALCATAARELLVVSHSDGAYTAFAFSARCEAAIRSLEVGYSLFFDVDPQHRGLARIEADGATRSATFSVTSREQTFEVRAVDHAAQLVSFVKLGIHHIWEGYDHLAFLLALLLPSVLQREERRWKPASAFRPALFQVLKIVTAFTLAHSITLSLSALDVVRLPSRFVESAIAASVILAAFNNVVPLVRHDVWLYAFALGLLHGFGFSATLMDLNLPRGSLVATLFGFNLGVEIGQSAVVAAFLPLAFWARRSWVYTRVLMVGGSIAIIVVACLWLVERAFVVKLIS
jgi:hypothetical protein